MTGNQNAERTTVSIPTTDLAPRSGRSVTGGSAR